jgi:uroporphyrinogen decarboxylase
MENVYMAGKETLTSRERLQRTLNHQIPDRVPLDLGGFQTGIHKKAYTGLLEYLGMEDEVQILDPVQQLAKPSEQLLERFHIDTRYIGAHAPENFNGKIEKTKRDDHLWSDLKDEFGVVWSMPEEQQLFMDISHHPLAEATIADLVDYPFPIGNDPTRFTGVREEALRLRRDTPYGICTTISGVVYEVCWYMRGLERWFMDTIENPEFCESLLDKVLQYWIDFETGLLGEIGDLVDVVMIGDDLAGQYGPLFSPDFYRRIVKPRQKKLVQHIKSLTNARVWYHTCGACSEYIPDLMDNGIDILNPVQISAKNMEPVILKKNYGDQLVFWGGGIDSQHTLPFASPQEVRNEVQVNLELFKPRGGYVFNNVHNIQHGVPPENIVALYDAAYEFGFYT